MNISRLIIINKKEKPTREEFIYMLNYDPDLKQIADIIKQFIAQEKIAKGESFKYDY